MADAMQTYMDRLAAALNARSLRVAIRGTALTAANPAVRTDDPQGKAMTPGLSQSVLLRPTGQGMAWYWVWPTPPPAGRPEPGAPEPEPTIELLCPAGDVERAARLIANVVSLRNEETTDV
jgi:hypothetical protein